jgi:hypothetical protein
MNNNFVFIVDCYMLVFGAISLLFLSLLMSVNALEFLITTMALFFINKTPEVTHSFKATLWPM